jgi:hypothetical protein
MSAATQPGSRDPDDELREAPNPDLAREQDVDVPHDVADDDADEDTVEVARQPVEGAS